MNWTQFDALPLFEWAKVILTMFVLTFQTFIGLRICFLAIWICQIIVHFQTFSMIQRSFHSIMFWYFNFRSKKLKLPLLRMGMPFWIFKIPPLSFTHLSFSMGICFTSLGLCHILSLLPAQHTLSCPIGALIITPRIMWWHLETTKSKVVLIF